MTSLGSVLRRFEREGDAHMTVAASEEDLRRLDAALGVPVPAPLRALLREVGAGLYDGGHEIFGPSRLMTHDIELVPDLLTVRARLAERGALPPELVPFHRAGATYHLIRAGGAEPGGVVSVPSGPVWSDLASFVEQVLLAPATEGSRDE